MKTVATAPHAAPSFPEKEKGLRFADVETNPAEANLDDSSPLPPIEPRGIFYPTPTHDGAMARIRIPAGQLKAPQLQALADLAEDLTTGYAQVTTRANLQLRVIAPDKTDEFLQRLRATTGLHPSGEGADNPRNLTAPPTAGIEPDELIDVSPYAHRLARHLVEHPSFAQLPAKFNLALDGGGRSNVLDSANDVTARALRVTNVPEGSGIRFRIGLGPEPLRHDLGVLVRPGRLVDTLLAVIRVHVERHDRASRLRSRMKHLLKRLPPERYLAEVERHLGRHLFRAPLPKGQTHSTYEIPPDPPPAPHPHVGVFPHDCGKARYVAAALPVGQITSPQMRGMAHLADEYGNGEIRLTTWQNVLLPHVPETRLFPFLDELEALGLRPKQSRLRSGIVACTGSAHCPYGQADVKRHARELADHLDQRLVLDQPVNVHLTGCPASCAQHYLGDLGLLAAQHPEHGQTYHLFVGGGFGKDRSLGRRIAEHLPANHLNQAIQNLLQTYLDQRHENEPFQTYANRQNTQTLAQSISVD